VDALLAERNEQMNSPFARALLGQFEAALAMLRRCVQACPEDQWDLPIAKYPFWVVAYHTLYCTDGYLIASERDWKPHPVFHPGGMADIDAEYPTKRFTQAELLAYIDFCRQRAHEVLAAETDESLAGASGFARLKFSRAELHLYNIRHIQHHTGQLGAFLGRLKIASPWVKSGWPE
jgi:hypothetical protein